MTTIAERAVMEPATDREGLRYVRTELALEILAFLDNSYTAAGRKPPPPFFYDMLRTVFQAALGWAVFDAECQEWLLTEAYADTLALGRERADAARGQL